MIFLSCSGQEKDIDIYLLIGQSNMAGRGIMTDSDTIALENVLLFDDQDMFEPARHPLNRYSTIRKGIEMQGINLGYEFGRTLSDQTGKKIGLVVNARGGTSIKNWQKGDLYYEEAVKRARAAMEFGKLRAIIWHQGSADRNSTGIYLGLLKSMVEDLRSDLGAPDLPFIAGQLGCWRETSAQFNKMITHVADSVKFSGWVSAENLVHNPGDSLHFDAPSLNILGRRYAEKTLELVYNK